MKMFFGLVVMAVLAPAVMAQPQLVMSEPFNYVNDAALNAVWNANATAPGPLPYRLDLAFGDPAPSYWMNPVVSGAPTGNRLARNLGGSFNGTDEFPLIFSMDFYLEDSGGPPNYWNLARSYVELRGYSGGSYGIGTLDNLLALGVNSNSDDGQYSVQYYQGRALYTPSVPLADWLTIRDAPVGKRALGWHELLVAVDSDSFDFYVDDVLGESVLRGAGNFPFNCVVLGSGYTTGGWDSWADNVRVEIVPEPASLVVMALGGLALLRRRR
ncbi:MAG: PEP-CTERM sorting domain-containing protein [Planctomycetota bacterium]